MKLKFGLAVLCLAAAACDGTTGPGTGGNVAIRFGAGTSPGVNSNLVAASAPGISADELTVTGTNGTLVIQDVRFIVEEMKLRSSESSNACDDDDDANDDHGGDDNLLVRGDRGSNSGENEAEHRGGDDDDDDECEFEGGPFVVDLPLDGDATIATQNVPAGTYDSFTFKIDDLEGGDDDEDDDRANAPNLLADIRTVYPNFPSRASLVVKGTQNGQPFTVYFRSKIRITQAITPPLAVPGDNALTVKIDPTSWFKNGTQVLDLLALNGRLVDLGNFSSGISGMRRGEH